MNGEHPNAPAPVSDCQHVWKWADGDGFVQGDDNPCLKCGVQKTAKDHRSTERQSITVRKRSIEVEAWQYTGADNIDNAPPWVREYRCQMWDDQQKRTLMYSIKPDLSYFDCNWYLRIPTPDGIRAAVANDWLILDVTGAVTSCKPHLFEETYERV